MKSDTDPDVFLSDINQICNELGALDETISTERMTTIILDALPADMYSTVKLEAIRDPDLSLEQIQRMMRTIFINHSERLSVTKKNPEYNRYQGSNRRGRETGLESAMSTAFITCHNCKKAGHKVRECKQLERDCEMEKSRNHEREKKWCSYHQTSNHSDKQSYHQLGKTEKIKNVKQKKLCSLHNSTNHSNQECFQQRNSSNCKGSDGRNSEEHETYVVDSTAVGCKSCCCSNDKVGKQSNEESKVEYSPPPGIGFSFACCHPPLSHRADGFQMLVDSGSSKHFVDPELVHRVESRMQDYTKISPPMEIKAAGHNTPLGIAQGTLLVVVRDTQDICRTVKLPIVLVPGLGRNLFSTAMAAQKGVKTTITKAGSIVDLGLFSIQLTRSDNLDHLDLAISKGSKRTESACGAISGKSFGKETVLTALVPQKYIALSSAVSMNIDQRSLQDGSSVVGHDNDSPTYRILQASTSKRSEARCCEKNNPPSSMVVIDEGCKSSDHLGNEYEIQNVKTTGSYNVGGDEAVEKQDNTSTLQFIEKSSINRDVTGEKTMNCCKQPTEKQLGASTSEVLGNNTKGLEKAVSPVCQIKVWATVVASGAMNLKNYKKWLKAIEPELKSTRATTGSVVAVVRSVLNIPQKVTSTRWAFKEKYDRSSKARQAVLGWKQKHGGSIDCVITSFVCRFDVLVMASAKRVNIPDVQNVLLGWIIGKNELKSTIHFSKLYRACRARASNKLATVIRFSSK